MRMLRLGLSYDYPDVIRPALQIHHTRPGARIAAGVYIMIVGKRTYLFTDATVNIDPSAEDSGRDRLPGGRFCPPAGLEPRVALLSFSNFGSTPHPLSDKVATAVELIKRTLPGLRCGW